MLLADRVIACFLIFLSLYFMWYASELPIGWNGMTGGPGGGAFGFWLSAIMMLASLGILRRSYKSKSESEGSFFDPEMLRSVVIVTLALVITVALLPWLGAYIALPAFTLWYLRFFG
ncbi:MAG: tripartite tricarboxylate transporter TctB family protein, partial [Paracoccaceae bacterium]